MNARQLLIILGIAVAGFAAAFVISGSSGGDAEPAKAGKQPAAADTIEVAGARVKASAPAAGALPALKLPKPKKAPETTAPGTTAPTTSAPDTTAPATTAPTTTAPTTTAPTTTAPTTTAPTQQTDNTSSNGNGGFEQTGGED